MREQSRGMTEIFGDFEDHLLPSQEYVRIQFSPSSAPLQQRWRNNGLSANFMADFLLNFFPNPDLDIDLAHQRDEIQGTICYVANELLENAMKFTDDTVQYPISLTLYLLSDRLVLVSTNGISVTSQWQLRAFIQRLVSSNPRQLYAEQLANSAQAIDRSAGLGILTIIHDYAATIGWKLETQELPPGMIVITMVQLAI